jgi:hypothetical protein
MEQSYPDFEIKVLIFNGWRAIANVLGNVCVNK